jgi:hypothetical protein
MKIAISIFVVFALFGCTSSKLFKEYELYRRDKTINYPSENLSLKFGSDSTGTFTNADNSRESFTQTFDFVKVNNDYLIVKNIAPTSQSLISLSKGDTIIIDKKRLHFFYNGDKKYFLSFKNK